MITPNKKRQVGKVTLIFSVIILILVISIAGIGIVMSGEINTLQNQVDSLQTEKNQLETDINQLQTSNSQLQTSYDNLQTRFNQLNSQYQQLQAGSSSSQNSIISSLQTQLAEATTLLAELQGPTGILPTYSDLSYVGPVGSGGAYWLQLSLKNTGSVPIKQIIVTIYSVQVNIPFTYLDSTVSASNPLPPYQTCTGKLNVTPPINNAGTYPLVIQAIATNSTIYTYQTTIT